jgi:hypothetical protein
MFAHRGETMMSSVMALTSTTHPHAHHVPLAPHRLVASAARSNRTTRCPRCGEVVALPDWADDGDLTECHGLLLRITCDPHGCQLESL